MISTVGLGRANNVEHGLILGLVLDLPRKQEISQNLKFLSVKFRSCLTGETSETEDGQNTDHVVKPRQAALHILFHLRLLL